MELNINIEEYLKKFRVHNPHSLFEPDFRFLKEFRCPICFHKLYWNLKRDVARCKSIRKDKFFIRKEVFEKLTV